MRPTSLKLEGFLSYRDALELDLSDLGAGAILGPNGSGKTSIVEAIGWALYGEGRGRSPDDYVNPETTTARVDLTFELAGVPYRVLRERQSGKAAKSYLGLFRLHRGLGQDPIGGDRIAETQAAIEDLLGMSYATWEATSLIAQGRADAFTRLRPAERKALLAEVLELGRYGRALEVLKGWQAEEREELAGFEADVRRLEERASTGAELAEAAVALLPQAESLAERAAISERDAQEAVRASEEAQERAKEVAEARRRAEDLERRLGSLRAEEARLAAEADRQSRVAARRPELEAAFGPALREATEQIDTAAAARDLASRAEVELEALAGEAAGVSGRMEELTRRREVVLAGEAGRCYACGQELPPDLREMLLKAIDVEAEAESDKATELLVAIEDRRSTRETALRLGEEAAHRSTELTATANELQRGIEEAERAIDKVGELAERATTVRQMRTELEDDLERIVLATTAPLTEDRDELERLAESLGAVARENRRLSDQAQRELGRIEAELEVATHAATELERLEPEGESRRRTLRLYDELAVAFGRDGIPALLIETAIPELSAGANELLGSLSAGRLTVRLDTLAAKRTGGMRETLDVIVGDDVSERPLEALSGGERQMVDLSLRIALSRLLAARAGRRIETLIVDEGFTALDDGGRQRTIEALHELASAFPTLLVVTHLPELAEAFETRLIVERAGGTSTVRREG